MQFYEYFKTPVYMENLSHWADDINKVCDKHINQAKKLKDYKERIEKKKSDFGEVAHSFEIASDPNLKIYIDHIGQRSWEFLDAMGFDLSNHTCVFTECWVQEFPKDGGCAHPQHVHANSHVSGFYFLDTQGSYPMFFDPRTRLEMISLPQQDKTKLTMSSSFISWKIQPGTLILIPAYIMHEYVPQTKQPFKFIHFNVQAIEKRFR